MEENVVHCLTFAVEMANLLDVAKELVSENGGDACCLDCEIDWDGALKLLEKENDSDEKGESEIDENI